MYPWDQLRLEKTETELKRDLLYGTFNSERRGSKSAVSDTPPNDPLHPSHRIGASTLPPPPAPDKKPGPPIRRRKPRKSSHKEGPRLGFQEYDGPRDPFGRRKKGEGYVLARWTGDNAGASGVFQACEPSPILRVRDTHIPLRAAHEVNRSNGFRTSSFV